MCCFLGGIHIACGKEGVVHMPGMVILQHLGIAYVPLVVASCWVVASWCLRWLLQDLLLCVKTSVGEGAGDGGVISRATRAQLGARGVPRRARHMPPHASSRARCSGRRPYYIPMPAGSYTRVVARELVQSPPRLLYSYAGRQLYLVFQKGRDTDAGMVFCMQLRLCGAKQGQAMPKCCRITMPGICTTPSFPQAM